MDRAGRMRRVKEASERCIADAAAAAAGEVAPESQEPMASSHAAQGACMKYLVYFCAPCNHDPRSGPPPKRSPQPPLPEGSTWFGPDDWARWWLRKGGYSNAEQRCDEGWTGLHYAVYHTTRFPEAFDVVRGLIPRTAKQRA